MEKDNTVNTQHKEGGEVKDSHASWDGAEQVEGIGWVGACLVGFLLAFISLCLSLVSEYMSWESNPLVRDLNLAQILASPRSALALLLPSGSSNDSTAPSTAKFIFQLVAIIAFCAAAPWTHGVAGKVWHLWAAPKPTPGDGAAATRRQSHRRQSSTAATATATATTTVAERVLSRRASAKRGNKKRMPVSMNTIPRYNYSFFQPFVGGATFVILQGLAWMIYSCAMVLALFALYFLLFQGAAITGFIGLVGLGGLLAQVLVMVSVRYFDGSQAPVCCAPPMMIPPTTTAAAATTATTASSTAASASAASLSTAALSEPLPHRSIAALSPSTPASATLPPRSLIQESSSSMKWLGLHYFGSSSLVLAVLSCLLAAVAESMLSLSSSSLSEVDPSHPATSSSSSSPHARTAWASFSVGVICIIMLLATGPLTHAAGKLYHNDQPSSGTSSNSSSGADGSSSSSDSKKQEKNRHAFRWFQPFRGGAVFVALQSVAWALYSICLVLGGWFVVQSFRQSESVKGLLTSIGASGLTSQLVMLVSLRYFSSASSPLDPSSLLCRIRTRATASATMVTETTTTTTTTTTASSEPETAVRLSGRRLLLALVREFVVELWCLLIVALLYNIHTIVSLSFVAALLAAAQSESLIVSGVTVTAVSMYFYLTYRNQPHVNGRREWPWARTWKWLWGSWARYFSFRVIVVDGPLNPNKQYIFGYAPHGILPLTPCAAPNTDEWKQALPGIVPTPLASSLLLFTPGARDLGSWVGGRDVSRRALHHSLSEGRSVILVPGGTAEMARCRSTKREMTLVAKHKGFVRFALQYKVDLVPMLAFGEDQTFANVDWGLRSMQVKTAKSLGFPFPLLPYGRWFLPIPNNQPLTLVVGRPISVSAFVSDNVSDMASGTEGSEADVCASDNEASSRRKHVANEEDVDKLHVAFYAEVERIFELYKAEAGFPDCTLKIIFGH